LPSNSSISIESIEAGGAARLRPRAFRATTDLLVVGAFTALVKLAGASKTAVSVRAFGMSHSLDCYLAAFALTSLICDVVAGALTPALIPAFVRLRTLRGPEYARSSYGTILYTTAAALTAVGLIAVALERLLFRVLASGFSQPDLRLTQGLFYVMLPMLPLTGITAVWRALLNSDNRFALAAATPIMTPLVATLFLSLAGFFGGIYALAFGSAAGSGLEVVALGIGVSRCGISILPRCSELWDHRTWFVHEYLPILGSTLLGGSRGAVDQAFAATLNSGSVSVLNLGTRLVTVLTSLGPAAASTVFFPRVSELTAKKRWGTLRGLVRRYLIAGFAGASVVALTAVVLSRPLAHIAFETGAAHPLNIALLSNVQAFSFIQLPFSFALAILVRVIVSAQLNRRLLLISAFGFATNIILDLAFSKLFGVSGIVLATSIVSALTCLAILVAARHLPRQDAS
jgi:putative peptidoglycan lipid II flippase